MRKGTCLVGNTRRGGGCSGPAAADERRPVAARAWCRRWRRSGEIGSAKWRGYLAGALCLPPKGKTCIRNGRRGRIVSTVGVVRATRRRQRVPAKEISSPGRKSAVQLAEVSRSHALPDIVVSPEAIKISAGFWPISAFSPKE
jgi:hypothetical protein